MPKKFSSDEERRKYESEKKAKQRAKSKDKVLQLGVVDAPNKKSNKKLSVPKVEPGATEKTPAGPSSSTLEPSQDDETTNVRVSSPEVKGLDPEDILGSEKGGYGPGDYFTVYRGATASIKGRYPQGIKGGSNLPKRSTEDSPGVEGDPINIAPFIASGGSRVPRVMPASRDRGSRTLSISRLKKDQRFFGVNREEVKEGATTPSEKALRHSITRGGLGSSVRPNTLLAGRLSKTRITGELGEEKDLASLTDLSGYVTSNVRYANPYARHFNPETGLSDPDYDVKVLTPTESDTATRLTINDPTGNIDPDTKAVRRVQQNTLRVRGLSEQARERLRGPGISRTGPLSSVGSLDKYALAESIATETRKGVESMVRERPFGNIGRKPPRLPDQSSTPPVGDVSTRKATPEDLAEKPRKGLSLGYGGGTPASVFGPRTLEADAMWREKAASGNLPSTASYQSTGTSGSRGISGVLDSPEFKSSVQSLRENHAALIQASSPTSTRFDPTSRDIQVGETHPAHQRRVQRMDVNAREGVAFPERITTPAAMGDTPAGTVLTDYNRGVGGGQGGAFVGMSAIAEEARRERASRPPRFPAGHPIWQQVASQEQARRA